ncbi:Protein-glutamate methylesterase/protein-glutamine glutaminase [Eubacterium plexicaudatum ASF492]|uniref:Stage 0 sporulation protein A homolog n=1 Tax=Eubacterium plexicaudatum ASF492 TaxID=1235802 RepID=N2B616_9FIRM|nr:Protein-glutamate methylesterase/protein-glutamine glutaminase [Eubacterium plexicaudatum ASF492]
MIKIFLVEDEIIIREAIHKMIPWESYGFEFAGEAKDGEMALPAIRSIRPDVLITDIKMPFMDGLTLSRLVLKELPDTKIVIVSGYDEFEYARQAISLGVEQYLLKPVSKSAFIEVLEKIREKYEKEVEQKDYMEKFRKDIREYEKNTRRDFFEMLVSGKTGLTGIYEKAEQLQIDILAECYNLVLFSVASGEKQKEIVDVYTPELGNLLTNVDMCIREDEHYLLFRNQMFSYAVLVKALKSEITQRTENCVELLTQMFEQEKNGMEWFICHASPVDRLSLLPSCYKEAMKTFALRYLGYSHVISCEQPNRQKHTNVDLRTIDTDVVNPDMIRNFLCQALPEEVESFVSNYFHLIGDDVSKSQLFCQYILLNVYFSVISFIEGLGIDKTRFQEKIPDIQVENPGSPEQMRKNFTKILSCAIEMRDESTRGKYQSMIRTAVRFMEENYADESLNLNKVACAVNVSANHFSALFLQEMKQTFIEYLTGLRMRKAKELLRCTDMRSGEIALEVGYKDAHYFSFLFKKTQGCTPSAYRSRSRQSEKTVGN